MTERRSTGLATERHYGSSTARIIDVNQVTRDRVPIHVVDQVDEAQHDDGDLLFAGDRRSGRLAVHQVLLRVVLGRGRRFGVHYLQYALDGVGLVENLCRHHTNDGDRERTRTALRLREHRDPGGSRTVVIFGRHIIINVVDDKIMRTK